MPPRSKRPLGQLVTWRRAGCGCVLLTVSIRRGTFRLNYPEVRHNTRDGAALADYRKTEQPSTLPLDWTTWTSWTGSIAVACRHQAYAEVPLSLLASDVATVATDWVAVARAVQIEPQKATPWLTTEEKAALDLIFGDRIE